MGFARGHACITCLHWHMYAYLTMLYLSIRVDDEEVSEGGIRRVIVLGYDGLPIQPVAPSSQITYLAEDPQTRQVLLWRGGGISAEEKPLPPVDSPTAESPGYVTKSDPEEDPKEYKDDETEDGSDEDEEDEDEEDKDEEEEEHLASADSTIVVPVDEPVFPPEGTEPRMLIRSEQLRKRLCLSTSQALDYEIGESSAATRGRGKDYRFVSTVDAEERQQGIRDVRYGIRGTWVDPVGVVPKIAPMTVGEVNTRVTELAELHERDTQDLYALLEDAQDSRSRISQRVDMDSQRVDLRIRDRMTL
ncbi:hypothetical protein Tco_0864816 [Tanacetum coccineum]